MNFAGAVDPQACWLTLESLSSKGLPLEAIAVLFDTDYYLWTLQADAAEAGHSGVSRPRVFVLMAHKTEAVMLHNPVEVFQQVTKEIKERVTTVPHDYFVATPREVAQEAMREAATRKITYIPAPSAA